MSGEVGLQW
jgi:hypothetical protein